MTKEKNMLKKCIKNDNNAGGALPLIIALIGLIVGGALYSLLFIEIGFPEFLGFIPSSDSKTFIVMMLRAVPLFVLFVFIVAVIKQGIRKDEVYYR